MQGVEHILLESDERSVPQRHTARRVHISHRFRSRLRRRVVDLEIVDYYYLFCRERNARFQPSECVLDLRFIDPSVRKGRHIPWRWFALTVGFAVFATLIWTSWPLAYEWSHARLPVGALLLFMAVCSGTVSVYRLTETLELWSLHGQAKLLELRGGLGALRSLRPFMVKLGAHLRIAVDARRRPHTAHLCDEVREHRRLKEAGVLSNGQYEESKKRILAHHHSALTTAFAQLLPPQPIFPDRRAARRE